jgi:hypothetical protein
MASFITAIWQPGASKQHAIARSSCQEHHGSQSYTWGAAWCSVHNATAQHRNHVIHLRFGRDNVRWVRGNQIKKRAKSLPAKES